MAHDGTGSEAHGCSKAHDASEPRHNRRVAATCCLAFAVVTAVTLVSLTVHHQPRVLMNIPQLFSFVPPVSPSVCLQVLVLFLTHATTQVLQRLESGSASTRHARCPSAGRDEARGWRDAHFHFTCACGARPDPSTRHGKACPCQRPRHRTRIGARRRLAAGGGAGLWASHSASAARSA